MRHDFAVGRRAGPPLARTLSFASLALLSLLALAPEARSTSVERLEPAEVVSRARTIVWGDCVRVQPEWDEDRRRILTRVQLAPRELIKGEAAAVVELKLLGGELDGMAYVIHGMPRFREGGEYVVQATAPHPRSGVVVPVGLGQGVHVVERRAGRPARATRDLRDLQLVTPGVQGGAPGALEGEPLDDVLARLRGLVAAERTRAGGAGR